jgi:hypothetical protein
MSLSSVTKSTVYDLSAPRHPHIYPPYKPIGIEPIPGFFQDAKMPDLPALPSDAVNDSICKQNRII